MKLTIGMAVYDDYDGAYFTIQALRLYHDLRDCELIVVDNSPHIPAGQAVKGLVEPWVHGKPDIAAARYLAMPDVVGTTQTRQRIFDEARGEAVLCLDSHVLLWPGAIAALLHWYDEHPECLDLLHGPMMFDDLQAASTHFDDQWRAEMWGTWGSAWRCRCGALLFGAHEHNGHVAYHQLEPGMPSVEACGQCGGLPPDIPWNGHETRLAERGCHQPGLALEGAAFPIPGQGLGLFTCRRQAWLGFNPHFRGFGGEEMYIHTKFRQAGRQTLCLPFLRWLHRFGRPGGVKYPLTRWNKLRNYVLGHQELGLPLDPVHREFVASGKVPIHEWQSLLEEPQRELPVGQVAQARPLGNCGTPQCAGASAPTTAQPPAGSSLEQIFQWCRQTPRDLDQHLLKIRELVEQVESVTAMVKRREWDVAVLAGRPREYVSFCTERDPLEQRLHELVRQKGQTDGQRPIERWQSSGYDSLQVERIMDTDLLILDTVHHADRLWAELTRFAPQVRRWILLRGTHTFGEVAEGGQGPGLLVALRRWMREHPEWSVIYHAVEQYGFTLISRQPGDKPPLPGKITMAGNFARAIAEHVADGMHHASSEQLAARLEICSLCEQRNGDNCSACGCVLASKASWRSSDCPLGRWPASVDAAPTEEHR